MTDILLPPSLTLVAMKFDLDDLSDEERERIASSYSSLLHAWGRLSEMVDRVKKGMEAESLTLQQISAVVSVRELCESCAQHAGEMEAVIRDNADF